VPGKGVDSGHAEKLFATNNLEVVLRSPPVRVKVSGRGTSPLAAAATTDAIA
jgi:hypothetical protein